ncbi:hypothetical protein BAGA_28805 [Bacillus gaemokensis]|uniref:Uncharacterized protein n=2 Tax=Bacillus gaemokensis TaxID=574375 RepID=A0A073KFV0_9BACI|nr:hypothetical protein BAGA_28805 [Bacillus gaemokensis]KYG37753.1 hypothetical protein AZF08_22660 [Bacillus gaemokensis]
MKKRILIPVMSIGFLIFSAFYSPVQNTVSAQINNEKSSINESEFWLYDGDPIRYYPYFNTFIGIADLSSSTEQESSRVVFEFYNLLGDLSYETSATIPNHNHSAFQPFSAPINSLENAVYSVKVKVINAKVDPNKVKFAHIE